MKKSFLFLISYFLLLTSTGCSIFRPKQKICKVIYYEKSSVPLKAIAIIPVGIGFKTGVATEFVPLIKSPLIVEDNSKEWLGLRKEKMIVDRETAEKISKSTSKHFYNILLKKKKFNRVVHSDSVRNVMENKKVNLGDFKRIDDLNKQDILNKLFVIADDLAVDGLIVSVIKKCETNIVYRSVRSTEREDLGERSGSMSYSYGFELEVGVFNTAEKKFVWIGESRKTASSATPELEQNILVAAATGKLKKFFRKYLTEKILKGGTEYQCVLKIVNTLPF